MSAEIKIPELKASDVKSVAILRNVVAIEYETECLACIQITRGKNVECFYETPICISKCDQCSCLFTVFFKSGELRCPNCGGCVNGQWTTAMMNTWGKG